MIVPPWASAASWTKQVDAPTAAAALGEGASDAIEAMAVAGIAAGAGATVEGVANSSEPIRAIVLSAKAARLARLDSIAVDGRRYRLRGGRPDRPIKIRPGSRVALRFTMT